MSKFNQLCIFFLNQFKGYKRNRDNSRRFRSYYMTSKEDTRSNSAKIIDFSLIRIFLFFLFFIVTYIYLNHLSIALFVSVLMLLLFHYISIGIRNKKLESIKIQKRRNVASQKVYQEILNRTEAELKKFSLELYSKLGFSNVRHIYNSHNILVCQGLYNGEKMLLSFYVYKNDFYVEMKEIKEILSRLHEMDIKRNVVITTSDFTKDAYDFVNLLNKNYRVLLLNKERMLKLIESCDMFPTDKEIDELIENKISRRNALWKKYKIALLSNKKSKSYFFLSLFLIIAAFYTPYPIYYMTVAGLSMGLTVITFISALTIKKDKVDEDYSYFSALLNDL